MSLKKITCTYNVFSINLINLIYIYIYKCGSSTPTPPSSGILTVLATPFPLPSHQHHHHDIIMRVLPLLVPLRDSNCLLEDQQ